MSGQLHAPVALPWRIQPLVPNAEEAGWAPETLWALWRREKSLVPTGIKPRLLGHPVSIPTELPHIPSRNEFNSHILFNKFVLKFYFYIIQ
jgi:hypothetical protein